MIGTRPAAALAALLVIAATADAAETRIRRWWTATELATGELEGLSLTEEGHLVPAPPHRLLVELDDLVVWGIARRGGELLLATGTDGRLLAIAGDEARVLLEVDEVQVQTVAVSGDRTWIGTSPDGTIRMAEGDGPFAVVATPEARHVWQVLPRDDGSVWIATGEPATVAIVSPDGEVETLLTSDEAHVLTLAVDRSGRLLAGTAGNGYVYQIDRDGRSRVLLDPPGTEVTSLATDDAGRVFVASAGEAGGAVMPAMAPAETDEAGAGVLTDATQLDTASEATIVTTTSADGGGGAVDPFGGPGRSFLHRIDTDGLAELLWSSADEGVHALAWFGDELVLGTGDGGRLLAVDPATGALSVRLELPDVAQITAITGDDDGLLLGTASLAQVWRVGDGRPGQGRYLSEPIDAGHLAFWGRVTLTADGDVAVATRSGNTRTPGDDWSDWASSDGEVASPAARFLQLRFDLPGAGREPTRVRGAELSYLPANLPPRIRRIEVLDPHVALTVDAPRPPIPPGVRDRARDPTLTSPPRDEEIRGARAVRWSAEDANGDGLEYTLRFRGEDETSWKTLAEELRTPFHSFDSTAIPDGWYRFEIVVSDHPSNPTERARTSSLVSEPFLIDNTPPVVAIERPRRRDGGWVAKVRSRDSASAIRWAEYAIDGGPWRPLLPDDRLFDEREEQLQVAVDVAAGEHTLVVRAEDEAGNVAAGKTVFTID